MFACVLKCNLGTKPFVMELVHVEVPKVEVAALSAACVREELISIYRRATSTDEDVETSIQIFNAPQKRG